MPVLYLLLAFHSLALIPLAFWQAPLGVLLAALLLGASVAALWSFAGKVGRGRHSYQAKVHAVQQRGAQSGQATLEVLCAMPARWKGHKPGQFVFVQFEGAEGAHPFTVASAPGCCGYSAEGKQLLRLLIKPLGDYTRTLHAQLRAGQAVQIEGPYGCFDAQGADKRAQVWIAGGVGITPFFALLQARQPEAIKSEQLQPAHLHYCTRDASADALLPELQALCDAAQPRVTLQVHDAAQGDYLKPQHLLPYGSQLDIWLCGPVGLGNAMRHAARHQSGWRLHQEAFQMR